MHNLITNEHVQSFQRDGVVLIKGLFADYVDINIRKIDRYFKDA